MLYVADIVTSPDTPLVIGAFVTLIGGFFALAKVMLNQASRDREADRKERTHLAAAITLMAKNSGKVAAATTKGAEEAKQRNGHLGEQNIHIAELVANQSDDIASIKASNDKIAETLSKSALIAAEDRADLLPPAHDQFIKEQTVVHQTVKGKETS